MVARLPLQAPDAVQLVASVELQLRVEDEPRTIVEGDADTVAVGTGTDAG